MLPKWFQGYDEKWNIVQHKLCPTCQMTYQCHKLSMNSALEHEPKSLWEPHRQSVPQIWYALECIYSQRVLPGMWDVNAGRDHFAFLL